MTAFSSYCIVSYRCKQCSEAAVKEPSAEGVEVIDEKIIAEGETE